MTARRRWQVGLPAAYLALSQAYAQDVERAAAEGWPTAIMDIGHMGMLTQPTAVVAHVELLLTEATRRAR